MEYKKTFHSVYSLTYHMVFVTKYRKPVISNEIGDFMKERAAYLCERFRGELISAETDMDHIHLLVSLPPSAAPSVVVRTLKTQLSREVREQYTDHVRKYLYGEDCPFWSSSYFIATTGSVSMETVKAYIDGQRTDAHKRKYEKTGRYKKSGSRRRRGNSSPNGDAGWSFLASLS